MPTAPPVSNKASGLTAPDWPVCTDASCKQNLEVATGGHCVPAAAKDSQARPACDQDCHPACRGLLRGGAFPNSEESRQEH